MSTKNNRYDVFKNDITTTAAIDENNFKKSEDPFQDFAKAAFSEFKIDKMMGHEFSNKLSDAKNLQQQSMNSMKVNLTYM